MPNFNYGTGGSSINLMDLLPGVEAMTKGFFGSPDQMNKNRQFDLSAGGLAVSEGQLGVSQGQLGVSRGRLSLDQTKQNQARANSIALADAFSAGMQRNSDGFIGVESLPLPEASRSGDLSSMAALLGAANEPQRIRLGLPTEQYARDSFIQSQGDPTKLALSDAAIDYGQAKGINLLDRELSLKNRYTKDLYGQPNINSGVPQAVLAIMRSGNPQEQIDSELAALERFGRAAGQSGGFSPEQKAAGEVFRDQLGLTTPVSPAEGNVSQRLSDMAVAAENAKTGFKFGTYDVNSKEGQRAMLMGKAGLSPIDQLNFDSNQKINETIAIAKGEAPVKQQSALAEILAKSSTPDVNTSEGRKAGLMSKMGMSTEDQLNFDSMRRLEEAREKAKLESEFPNISTETGYKAIMAQRAGIPAKEQYATEVKPLIIPEGGTAMIPQGSYLERNFKPSVDKVALAKQAEETLSSMTREEIMALQPEQRARLLQAVDAGRNALPAPMKPDNIGGRFPTKEEAPKAGQLVYDGSLNSVSSTKLEKIEPKVDHEFDKLLDAYENVTRAIEATKKYPGAFGNQFSLASMIPVFGESAKNAITEKGETAARAVVFDATSQKKHEIYGAALTGGEQLDANNFLPSGKDSADKVREKLQALQSNIYNVIERRMDTFHPFNGTHFLKGYESGRKMIDPASMQRAQQKNSASNRADIPARKD